MSQLDLDTFKGWELPYYGACNNAFKVGKHVLEAIENENDGYRSSLEHVRVVPEEEAKDLIFSPTPIAVVKIERSEDHSGDNWVHSFTGHVIKDAIIDFVWGEVGTNNHDDYYPSFNATFHALNPEARYKLNNGVSTIDGGKSYATLRDRRLRKLGVLPKKSQNAPAPAPKEERAYKDNPLYGVWG